MLTPSWPCSLAWHGSCPAPTAWMAPRSTSSEPGCQGEPGSEGSLDCQGRESRSRSRMLEPATGQKDRGRALCVATLCFQVDYEHQRRTRLCSPSENNMAASLSPLPSSPSSFLLPSPLALPSSPSLRSFSPFSPTPLLLLPLIFRFNMNLLSILYRPGAGFHHWGCSSGHHRINPALGSFESHGGDKSWA